jgi:NAD-dependent dihydropyrimidine dehydrogenase PreA subunit
MSFLPLFCQHCANAPCVSACTPAVIKRRDDGLVWIDASACTGCGKCREACPYGVIFMNPELGIAQKCTGCAHRVDQGLLPRCVDVCPHEAIAFGEADSAPFAAAGRQNGLEIYLPEHRTEPRVLWKGLPRPWIAGAVIDAVSDEVLEDVEITAIDPEGGVAATVRSDAFGDFWLRGLGEQHDYRVELRKAGYKQLHRVVTTDRDQDLGTVALEKLP